MRFMCYIDRGGVLSGCLSTCATASQTLHKRLVELHAGVESDIIDAAFETFATVHFAEPFNFCQVIAAKTAGVDLQFFLAFGLFQLDNAIERKSHFSLVQHMKQDDVVSAVPQ